MHLQKAQFQIGEEPTGGVSSPRPETTLRIQTEYFVSTSSTNPPTQTHQNQIPFHHEPTQALPSTPHKRPVMARSSSMLSRYPTPSSPHDYPQSGPISEPPSPFFPSLAISFATKSLVLRCFRHMCCARMLRFRLRFLILLSLPSLYFFVSNPRRSYVLDVLSLLAFASVILISLNVALPRLPSIRLLLARSSPISFSSSPASKPAKPVVWSIGSKPKSERHANSGSWVQVYSNGDVYEGEFHKGKCSGSGVYYYSMKGRYEGDWVDEKYDGYGVETWARGSRYRGQYRQGLRHGIGVYRFYTGDVYAGEWSNGQCHGFGVHTCEDGSRYVGEFKWGVKHGLGHYHFRNGDTYSGEYFADKMHGFGIYRFANGHQYEGAWHEGRRQGLGMYTFRNGETQSGHWQNGVLNALSMQNPGSPYAVDHSKVLNVVQEAQRVAARARNLGGVDERVNRAVAAANKAATAARVAAVKAVQRQMHMKNYSDDEPVSVV